ncbi:MAG: hypothetical protein JW742_01585 [Candidatus Aminicenantes bacterium]|nr:hypothetical protein [Candidatus Aminicenantes bacterium]
MAADWIMTADIVDYIADSAAEDPGAASWINRRPVVAGAALVIDLTASALAVPFFARSGRATVFTLLVLT